MSFEPDERLVTTSLPAEGQLRVIFAVVVTLVIALGVTAPYALQPTRGTEIFVPAYAAAIFVVEVTTAAILLATFRVRGSVQLLVLASGYLLSGVLSIPWVLTFPGVFQIIGLDQNLQATAWIATIRRLGFAAAVVGYAAIASGWTVRSTGRWIILSLAGLAAFVALSLWILLAGDDYLPPFMLDTRNTAPAWGYVPALSLALYAMCLVALLARVRSALDIWMCVVLFSLSVEILLISYLGGGVRLSVGWWSGRFFGLVAAATVLMVLLSETTENYMRLARAAANERRSRRNRLVAMEAFSASIAHEINQPLSSIVNSANAGLRWLSRADPPTEKIAAALKMIADEGYRADKVVSGIRQMFLKGAQQRVATDLRAVIDAAVSRSDRGHALADVAIERLYPPGPMIVVCNPVQLGQVVANLLENSVDAMKDRSVKKRKITVRINETAPDEIEVSCADTGPGINSDIADRIFLPFVTAKPDGMGMGLMFCQSVIEAHGGHIWVAANGPTGAEFRFTLPASDVQRHADGRSDG